MTENRPPDVEQPPGPEGESLNDPHSRGRWELSYRARLVLGVVGLVLLTGVAVTWLAHRSARASTEALADSLFREVSNHAVTHTRAFVLRAAPLVESLRALADKGLDLGDSDRLAAQLLAVLRANPGLSWVSYGDESGTFTGTFPTPTGLGVNQSRIVNGHTHLVEHDVLADGSWRVARRDDDSGYDPRKRPWYRKASQEGRVVWLPPYVFYNQGVPGISCAAPVLDKGRLRGAFSIDFDLNALSDFIAGLSVSEHSRLFLFTADEVLLAHPHQRGLATRRERDVGRLLTLADTEDPLVEAFRHNLRPEHVQTASEADFHFFEFTHDATEYLASATAFRIGGDLIWVVGAIAPKADFLAGVWHSQALALVVAGAAILVAVLLAVLMAGRVSGPVLSLIGFMQRVGGGDLEARADFGGSREFRELSRALNRMIVDLRDRLRLRHSLNVAMEVQQRLLPQRPPQVRGLDVAGHSTYCDETGGDYYDFLVLDQTAPDSVLVALGDVMGHGVAAALVMAGARAVLRDRADTAGGLADLMGRLNRLLAADLEGTRFMTMHLSVLDARTGLFRWVSAGHDPALLFDPATDRFEEPDVGDLPLGILEETEYTEHSYSPLRPGQVIVVGTDGVWESPNAAGEQFGKPRLREAIREAANGTAEQIVQTILDRLAAFRGDCRAVDDVTFVVIRVLSIGGPEAAGS
jgi:serine phosphatase RsbU (regulator of sigma subunit)